MHGLVCPTSPLAAADSVMSTLPHLPPGYVNLEVWIIQTHTRSSQRLYTRLRCPVFKPICYCCLHRSITLLYSSVTDGQRPLLACSFQAAKQMCGRHKKWGKCNCILFGTAWKNSFYNLTNMATCLYTGMNGITFCVNVNSLLKHILQAGFVPIIYFAWLIFSFYFFIFFIF